MDVAARLDLGLLVGADGEVAGVQELVLAALFAFGRLFGARFLRRRLGGRKLDYYLARYRVGEPNPAALVFEMLAERVEYAAHEGPGVDDLLVAGPLADEAERVFAGPDQRPAAEALEAGIHAAVPRNELLLMTRLDPEPHDIERRHLVLPTLKA
jgi:hypothetical protein